MADCECLREKSVYARLNCPATEKAQKAEAAELPLFVAFLVAARVKPQVNLQPIYLHHSVATRLRHLFVLIKIDISKRDVSDIEEPM